MFLHHKGEKILTALTCILLALLAIVIGRDIVFAVIGKEEVSLQKETPQQARLIHRTENSVTIAAPFSLVNEGKQSALIIDVIVRPQLAFEQYDGIAAHGKAEMEGRPREDEYFEAAVLFAKGDPGGSNVMNIDALITLTARNGQSIEDALSRMVDLPVDLIYMFVGRVPCHYEKSRIILTAEEIASLVGVKLVAED